MVGREKWNEKKIKFTTLNLKIALQRDAIGNKLN